MSKTYNRRRYLQQSAIATIAASVQADHLLASANDDQKRFRVGVIGHTGRGNFGHGLDKMWQQVDSTETVAISDSAGISHAKSRLPNVAAFDDYHQMLRSIKPDIVSVAPRHIDQHFDMCIASIESGAKGIYIEKPFCQTPKQADAIINACRDKGTRLAVAHRNRYHPVLGVIKNLIQAGEIGELLEIRARGKEDQRGGALDLWVLGSHVLNIACFFLGEPVACQGKLYQDGRPCNSKDIIEGSEGVGPLAGNELHARFEMSSGTPLFFDSIQNRGTREAGFGLQIIGNEGVIDLRIDREPLAHLRRGNPFQPNAESSKWQSISSGGIGIPEPISNLGSYISSHQAAGDNLVQSIRSQTDPTCDGKQGRQTVEMICGIFASHQNNGAAISLPLSNREHPLER